MRLIFPKTFAFGTSTSAYQIETPFEHDWINVRSRDENVFNRTTDHEKMYKEDCDLIASLAPHYRMSLMWSKLQRQPFASLDEPTIKQYCMHLEDLRTRGVQIMMVLHHFANPLWFSKSGGWLLESNIARWVDYGKKVVDTFGQYVTSWNTFNEPNLYTSLGWIAGEFPPFSKNIFKAKKVISNIANAHQSLYDYIKNKYPDSPVGISHNCTVFEGDNLLGKIPAKVFDWLFMDYAADQFRAIDFFGMSYYARIGFDPFPLTYLEKPDKLKAKGKAHDDMWEYYPEGLKQCITRFWKKYKKPIIITENGICTNDDTKRIKAIRDYVTITHQAIQEGVDVRGYYHWSTWDNFEWSLGPEYKFGLCECHWQTKERKKTQRILRHKNCL
ncbi:MAG: family 1 glycosylhydrolase [Cyclobacteriaceae bacterium]